MSKEVVIPIGDIIRVIRRGKELVFECTKCGYDYGSTKLGDPKKNALMREFSIGELSPLNKYGLVDEFVAREFYCPKCGIMISANIQIKGEPIMMDYDFSSIK